LGIDFRIVIPARYASQRLPGKPLRVICGKTMIEWVYRAAQESTATEVVVATDDQRIASAVAAFGGQACITSETHPSGTDRVLEVCQIRGWADEDIVVNLQGDEPLMPAVNMTQVADNLETHACDMATLHKTIDAEHALDPNLVKLVHDDKGRALYFSRSCIPYDRNGQVADYCGHIGIYAYRIGFIKTFSSLAPSPLEKAESLEQLRAITNGFSIHSEIAKALPGPGIDTEQDLAKVARIIGAAGR